MSSVTLSPAKLAGKVFAPPSKSASHRRIICACLARGESRVENLSYSQDIKATIQAMRALGAQIHTFEDYALIDGSDIFKTEKPEIFCNMSGSTLRFVLPIALAGGVTARFTGADSLARRPIDRYYSIMDRQNIAYFCRDRGFDLTVSGKLSPGVFYLPGDVSSQYVTGLLFALPLLNGDSEIRLTTPLQSKGYIDLTLDALQKAGIEIENDDGRRFFIRGGQSYACRNYRVEGDYSSAAFFLCAGAMGCDVEVKGLDPASKQGDRAILNLLQQAGCHILWQGDGVKVKNEGRLKGISADCSQFLDIVPVLAARLSVAEGESRLSGCGRLRIKECDRFRAILQGLNALGGKVRAEGDSLVITGVPRLSGGRAQAFDDHRMAMTFAVAAARSEGNIIIDNRECVAKSYPDFWRDFAALGGQIL